MSDLTVASVLPAPFQMRQRRYGMTGIPAQQRVVSLVFTDIGLIAAIAVLVLGFALPQACTLLQIVLIAGFILQGSAAWLPAIVALLLTPTDFKAGGVELQVEKFEAVTVDVLGFPMTASYAIVGAVLVRGLIECVAMPLYLKRGLNRLWLAPVGVAAAICVYAAVLALDSRTPGWSAAARATLLPVSLWYAVGLTRDPALVREVIMRRMGPLCGAIVACGFFAPLFGTFTCFYLSMAVSWAALVALGGAGRQYPLLWPLAWATLVACIAVPIGGLRVSTAVAAASYAKMGNSSLSTMSLAMAVTAGGLALFHRPVLGMGTRHLAQLVTTAVFAMYLSLPFFVAQFSTGREFETEGNVGTIQQRITYKFFVERPAIWRGSIEAIKEPPYVIVPPNRVGSMITAGGQRTTFRHSAHNLVLDILRSQGLVSGAISLLMLYICFGACVRAYMTSTDPAACVAAITFIAGGLVNGIGVGHLLETGTGFMLYVCAGVALGTLAMQALMTKNRLQKAVSEPRLTTTSIWSANSPASALSHRE